MASFLNPCLCPSSTDTPTTPSTSGCGITCICLCDVTVDSADYPDICNSATINLETYIDTHDVTLCNTDQKYWSIQEYDTTFFETLSVDLLTGDITWKVFKTQSGVGQAIIKFSCGQYAGFLTFTAGANNPCDTVVCPEGQVCNPCDGTCGPPEVDFTITID